MPEIKLSDIDVNAPCQGNDDFWQDDITPVLQRELTDLEQGAVTVHYDETSLVRIAVDKSTVNGQSAYKKLHAWITATGNLGFIPPRDTDQILEVPCGALHKCLPRQGRSMGE